MSQELSERSYSPETFGSLIGGEIDFAVNSRVHNSLARDTSRILIGRNAVYKALNPKERTAYQFLLEKNSELKEFGIHSPEIMGMLSGSELNPLFELFEASDPVYALERLEGIKPLNLSEFFGVGVAYQAEDYLFLFSALDKLRAEINLDEVEGFGVYPNQGEYLERQLTKVGQISQEAKEKTLALTRLALSLLEGTSPLAAHRDLNLGNFAILDQDGHKQLQIVDFETFGLAYPGYDEGRLLIHLSLNQQNQQLYVETFEDYCQHIAEIDPRKASQHLIAFWTTAVIRAWVEMAYFETGFYDSRAEHAYGADAQAHKNEIYENLKVVAEEAEVRLEEVVGIK